MAKIDSLLKMSGTHGNQTFYILDGKQYSRRKTSLNKEKFYSKPSMRRSRENALNFGAAGKAAREVYIGLLQAQVKQIARYCFNGLTTRIHTALLDDQTQGRARAYLGIEHVANALGGVHLGPENPHNALLRVDLLSGTEVTPEGQFTHASHNVTAVPHARIAGLDLITTALKPGLRPGTHLQFRLQLVYVPFYDLAFDPIENGHVFLYQHPAFPEQAGKRATNHFDKVDTDWLPADGLDTCLRIPLPDKRAQDGSETQGLWFIALEWRAYTGRRFKNLEEFSTLALAGIKTVNDPDLPQTLPHGEPQNAAVPQRAAQAPGPRKARKPIKPHKLPARATATTGTRTTRIPLRHQRSIPDPARPKPAELRRQRARLQHADRLAELWTQRE